MNDEELSSEDASDLHLEPLPHDPAADKRPTLQLDDPALDAELPKPKSRWFGRLVLLLIVGGLGALVWQGPFIASAGPWRSAIVAAVLPPIDGSLSIREARFRWFEPVTMHGVEIRDAQGAAVLSIESVALEHGVFDLATHPGRLGTLKAVKPHVELTAKDGATNYAQVFAQWGKPKPGSPAGSMPRLPRELRIQIESGEWLVTASDEHGQPVQYHINDWNADLGLDLDRDGPWTARGVLREGDYHFVSNGQYDAKTGVFTVAECRVHSQHAPWALDTRGQFSMRAGQQTDLKGSIRYDLDGLAAQLRPILGPSFALEGDGFSNFEVVTSREAIAAAEKDPSASELKWVKPLTGGLDVAWQKASWSGIDVGPATAATRLQDAVLSINVPETDVSGGVFQTHASLDLLAGQPTVVVQPGRLLQDFELTPKICDGAMRFILPALADSARIAGRTTLDLEACRIPLHDPTVSDLKGRLTIHAIEVGLNETSLMHRLAGVLRLPGAVKVIDGAEVDFVLKDHRVESKGFKFRLGNVEVQIYGSVGLDESLALLAETAIPAQWLGDGPLARLLKSQNVRIPIGGTLKQPKIETERLGEVNAGLTQDMAGVLERGLSVGDEWAKGMGEKVRSGSGLLEVLRGLADPEGAPNNPNADPAPAETNPDSPPRRPGIGERLLEGLEGRIRRRLGGDNPPPVEKPPQ